MEGRTMDPKTDVQRIPKSTQPAISFELLPALDLIYEAFDRARGVATDEEFEVLQRYVAEVFEKEVERRRQLRRQVKSLNVSLPR
jgi:hypothetical protein